jgi:hypothetical protein
VAAWLRPSSVLLARGEPAQEVALLQLARLSLLVLPRPLLARLSPSLLLVRHEGACTMLLQLLLLLLLVRARAGLLVLVLVLRCSGAPSSRGVGSGESTGAASAVLGVGGGTAAAGLVV